MILNYIKSRKLDTFFELEEKIMSKTQALEKTLLEIITDSETGTPEDKLRLFLIYYICTQHLSEDDLRKFEHSLTETGCDLSSLLYIKRWK